jgi:hypothetical protein
MKSRAISHVSVELKAVSEISSVSVIGVNVNDHMSLMFLSVFMYQRYVVIHHINPDDGGRGNL